MMLDDFKKKQKIFEIRFGLFTLEVINYKPKETKQKKTWEQMFKFFIYRPVSTLNSSLMAFVACSIWFNNIAVGKWMIVLGKYTDAGIRKCCIFTCMCRLTTNIHIRIIWMRCNVWKLFKIAFRQIITVWHCISYFWNTWIIL